MSHLPNGKKQSAVRKTRSRTASPNSVAGAKLAAKRFAEPCLLSINPRSRVD
jgi:hypothetical protein